MLLSLLFASILASPGVEWTRFICDESPAGYIGWPTVATLANGEVMAVFSGAREGHVCPFGKVQMVRSSDNGETWSAPVTLADIPGVDDRDAGIVQMPDGEIVVMWFTSVAFAKSKSCKTDPRWRAELARATDAERAARVGYYRIGSKDGGKTWSKPEKLANVDQTPHGPILLRNGTLLCLGRGDGVDGEAAFGVGDFKRTVVTASVSKDAGHTWEMICKGVPQDPSDYDRGFHEPHVAELADGTLVGMVRYQSADYDDEYMRVTFSKDGGRTWSVMKKTPLRGHPPFLTALADGRLLCVYARRQGVPDRGEIACFSSDGGKTWDVEHEIVLQRHYFFDMGYPSTCLTKDGKLLTVYYGREQAYAPDGKTVLKDKLYATKWSDKK